MKAVSSIDFQWLRDYLELEERITHLKWNINKTKLELIRWVEGDLSRVRLTKESRGAKVEKVLAALEDELSFTVDQEESLLMVLDDMQEMNDCILFKKYVEGKGLEGIAEELDCSRNHVAHRHSEVMKKHPFIKEYQERIKKFKRGIEETEVKL